MTHHSSWLAQFVAQPRKTAAITQASSTLAGKMARMAREGLTPEMKIIELGCGYGSVTRALLKEGVSPQQMVCLDITRSAVERTRKLGVNALAVDARYLRYLMEDLKWNGAHRVVSSLGLLSMPADVRNDILIAVSDVLLPGGNFIQYTYGFGDPTKGKADTLGWRKTGKDFTWKNIPPAHIWRWTKPVDPVVR